MCLLGAQGDLKGLSSPDEARVPHRTAACGPEVPAPAYSLSRPLALGWCFESSLPPGVGSHQAFSSCSFKGLCLGGSRGPSLLLALLLEACGSLRGPPLTAGACVCPHYRLLLTVATKGSRANQPADISLASFLSSPSPLPAPIPPNTPDRKTEMTEETAHLSCLGWGLPGAPPRRSKPAKGLLSNLAQRPLPSRGGLFP